MSIHRVTAMVETRAAGHHFRTSSEPEFDLDTGAGSDTQPSAAAADAAAVQHEGHLGFVYHLTSDASRSAHPLNLQAPAAEEGQYDELDILLGLADGYPRRSAILFGDGRAEAMAQGTEPCDSSCRFRR